MRIAFGSGKGGTGKTTVSVNLAVAAALSGMRTEYVDCDVEEPNGHIFLRPDLGDVRPVEIMIPEVDGDLCTGCGECAGICGFNAIAVLAGRTLVFPELCHSCGGCRRACPGGAITEVPRETGTLMKGGAVLADGEDRGANLGYVGGKLNIGEAMAVPVIRAVKGAISGAPLTVVDAPPGVACPMVESVRGSDMVILVAEPTPFGLHDLGIAVEAARDLEIPAAVIINRSDSGDGGVRDFCREEGVEILAEIPDSREVAAIYSRGGIVALEDKEYGERMKDLLSKIMERAGGWRE
jgi:MinD superfamily P-loop ATPase